MVFDIIKQDIETYKDFIQSPQYDEIYKWEALQKFQDAWDIDAADFRTMYDNSFKTSISDNLWANPHWFPKSVMLNFIDLDQERVRTMFCELFDELHAVGKRIDRFVWHCDELLKELIKVKPSNKSHYHDGQRIITLYLAFRFPDKYAIYKFTEFKTFMDHVRAKDVPGTGEYERFFKVVRTVYNIISKDEQLLTLHKSLLPDGYYKGDTLMVAQDFIWVTARRYM